MNEFITILAWVFGVISSLVLVLRIYLFYDYDEIAEFRDAMKGMKRTFPITIPASISIICLAWLFANW